MPAPMQADSDQRAPSTIRASPRAATRLSWARSWLLGRRAESATDSIHVVLPHLGAAADLLHPLLLEGGLDGVSSAGQEARANTACLFNVHRHTLDLMVQQIGRQELARRALAPTTPTVRQAIVGRVLHEVQGRLRHFAPVAEAPGFFRALARTLDELRQHQLPCSELAALGDEGHELALMLSSYHDALIHESLADRATLFGLATEALSAAKIDDFGDVMLVDVPLRFSTELAFVACLGQLAGAVVATVPHGDSVSLAALKTAWPGAHVDKDHDRAENAALQRLQRQLFSTSREGGAEDDTATIFSAATAPAECTEIARRVLQQVRSGVPAERIAVVVRQFEPYVDLMVEALERAGIAVYPAEGAYRPDPAGRALLLLLRCRLERLRATRFAEYLSLGQIPRPDDTPASRDDAAAPRRFGAGDDAETHDQTPEQDFYAPARWERLIGDAAVIGGIDRWRRRIAGLQRELSARLETEEDPNSARASAIKRDQGDLAALAEFSLPLLARLDALPDSASWGEWIAELIPVARRALRRPQRVLDLLEELRPLAHTGPVELHRVVDALSQRLADLRRAAPAHRYGRVYLGLAHEIGGRCFDVVFVPGIAERSFPKKLLQDPVLLDRLRLRLNQGHAVEPLLPVARERRLDERLALHLAVGAATQVVALSYPRMDIAQGQPRVPSFYLLEAARAVRGQLPAFEQLMADAASRARPGGGDPQREVAPLEDAVDEQQYDAAVLSEAEHLLRRQPPVKAVAGYCAHLHLHPFLIRALRAHWLRARHKLTTQDGLVSPGDEARQLLAAESLKNRPYAATTLERYGRCPYRFYLAGVLRLKPRQDLEPEGHQSVDALTRGRLLHEVQFELFRTLRQRSLLPLCAQRLRAALDLLAEQFESVSQRYREELAPAVEVLWQQEMRALSADLVGWLRREAEVQNDYQPLHFELSFGLRRRESADASSSSDPVHVGPYSLRGAIDLVERGSDQALRVTDYKSGSCPASTGGVLQGGASLQRVLYGLAAEALFPGRPAAEGRLYYCTERGGYRELTVQLDEHVREDAVALLRTVDKAIEAGFLPAVPRQSKRRGSQREECDHCDYLRVCGRGVAQRVESKLNDPRLDPLKRVWRL